MIHKLKYCALTFASILFVACGSGGEGNSLAVRDTIYSVQSLNLESLKRDTVELIESYKQEDIPVNEYLIEQLKPIRANFKRINSIDTWTNIRTKDIWETTEGGHAKFYYLNGRLEKIISRCFGETFQLLSEYYLLNGELSFVYTKFYKYNRPIYCDSTHMKESDDTEVFDFEKSEVIEDRSYFDNGKLLHQINNQDCSSPFAKEYLMNEGEKIVFDFKYLLELVAKE